MGKTTGSKGQTGPSVLILLGAPGAGKGTQSKVLARTLGIPHISTGDLLREQVRRETAIGKRIKEILERGNLVPDSTMMEMLADRMSMDDCRHGYLLDGFPRTMEQMKMLDTAFDVSGKDGSRPVLYIIVLRIDQGGLVRRISGRRVCPACGMVYSANLRPPQTEGLCDRDESKLIVREDDREEVVLRRLQVYNEQTAPIIDHYAKHASIVEINGDQTVEQITSEILNAIVAWGLHFPGFDPAV
jgi:adenylate kinase